MKPIKSLLRFLLRVCFARNHYLPVLLGPLKGYQLPKSRGLSQLSMLFGVYEKSVADTLRANLAGHQMVYDIGANYGYMSLVATSCEGTCVVAFEPVPALAAELSAVVTINQLEDRIHIVRLAVSASNGSMRLLQPGSDETGVLEQALQGQAVDESQAMTIETVTLDDWFAGGAHPAPDLIKIDVEGAEDLVLAGALTVIDQHQPDLLIEIHGAMPAAAVWHRSELIGYQAYLITDNMLTLLESMAHFEAAVKMQKWTICHLLLLPKGKQPIRATR